MKICDDCNYVEICKFKGRVDVCEHKTEFMFEDMNDISVEIYKEAVKKGLWEGRDFNSFISDLHAEVSEAYEEHKRGRHVNEVYYSENGKKPEGIAIELADVVLMIMSFCGKENIDIEGAMTAKVAYNRTRPYKHGWGIK